VPPLSIVVLPFANLSGDAEHDYFVDGITDDLTTDLSRLVNSFVIARTTAFIYKDKAVDVKQIGRDLGVRYVVEGAVRRAGAQVQVNIQLIDAESGAHLWAHRFEAERAALAETEDDIVRRLGRALSVQVLEAGVRQSTRDKPNPDADDFVMRGWAFYQRLRSSANLDTAQRAFEQALSLDPSSAAAQIGLAMVLTEYIGVGLDHIVEGVGISREQDIARSERLLAGALESAPDHAMGHAALGRLHRLQNRLADARIELEKAIELDRNNVFATLHLGITLLHLVRLAEARRHFEKTLLLAPLDLSSVFFYFWLGYCQLLLGNVDIAIELLRKSRAANAQSPGTHLVLAAAHGLRGDFAEARDALRDFHRLKPGLRTLAQLRAANPNWTVTPEYFSLREATVGVGLRRAGVPEA
jgi:TolB-like protein/Tfp pilus assembly protein PilF